MDKEFVNLDSTDYEIDEIKNVDRRFETGCKDCKFFHILGVVTCIIANIFMYVFGCCDPAEMKYFLGLPLWFSGGIIIYLVMFVIGMVYMYKWEDFPFTAREKEGGSEE